MSLGILIYILENICTILFLTFHLCSGISFNRNIFCCLIILISHRPQMKMDVLKCVCYLSRFKQFLCLIHFLEELGEKNIITFIFYYNHLSYYIYQLMALRLDLALPNPCQLNS